MNSTAYPDELAEGGNPGRRERVEIIGHRGAPRAAPENTMAGFELALEAGADAIELDVHASADGVVLVHHDPALGPGAPPSIAGHAISTMTADRLRAATGVGGEALLPTLAEVLAMIGQRARAYVEIKGTEIERAVIACVKESGVRCAIHSFDHRVSATVRALAPETRTGILLESRLADPAGALRAALASDYWQQWERVDGDLVSAVHAAGGRVIAWTVNDPEVASSLLELGVDGICTDVPSMMRPLVTAGS